MGITGLVEDIQPFAELFEGATTLVYKAYQRSEDRFVLLKTLRPEYRFDEDLSRRFEEEARIASSIEHPNVVRMLAYGQGSRGAYLVAEYVDGLNLADIIAAGKTPPELSAYVLRETGLGLQAAHDMGILHRDIKPSNILVSFDGQVKLTDFGMASLIESGQSDTVRGTLAYLAPEHALGEPITRASDLFSLGATFFEMLTGRRAFTGVRAGDYLDSVLHHDPLPFLEAEEGIPRALKAICRKLLDKSLAARYSDAAELLRDLNAYLDAFEPSALPETMASYLADPGGYTPPARRIHGDGALSGVQDAPVIQVKSSPVLQRNRSLFADRSTLRILISVFATVFVLTGLGHAAWKMGLLDSLWETPGRDSTASTFEPGSVMAAFPDITAADSQRVADAGVSAFGHKQQALALSPSSLKILPEAPVQPIPTRRVTEEGAAASLGTLHIDVQPFATVYVNGDSIGVTPLSGPLRLARGTHRVVLKHKDFPETRRTVQVKPGEEANLFVSLWNEVGRVSLEVSPWADVYVDGRYYDTTPLDKPLYLTPGSHELSLKHHVLGTWTTRIFVVADSNQVFKFNLTELLSSGSD